MNVLIGAKSTISVPAKKTEQKKKEILPVAAKENKQKEGDSSDKAEFEKFKAQVEKEREKETKEREALKAQLEKQEKEREKEIKEREALKAQLEEKQKKIDALESQNQATKDLQDSEPGTGIGKDICFLRLIYFQESFVQRKQHGSHQFQQKYPIT
ncbi:MAG: hypothetical protein Q7U68_04890 [Candidatus Roizmanbacteria bacterium]|nr:hypothetical protein [Candidatus Roizmanbacteria bacterium]